MKNKLKTTLILTLFLSSGAFAQEIDKAKEFIDQINKESDDIIVNYKDADFDKDKFYYQNVSLFSQKDNKNLPITISKLTISNTENPNLLYFSVDDFKSSESEVLEYFKNSNLDLSEEEINTNLKILEKLNSINKGDYYYGDFLMDIKTVNDKSLFDIHYSIDNIGSFAFKMVTSGYDLDLEQKDVEITEPKIQELQTLQFNAFNVQLKTLFNLGEFKEFLPPNYKSELLELHPKEVGLGLVNAFENNKKIDITINLEKPVKVDEIMNAFFTAMAEKKPIDDILPKLFDIKTTIKLDD